MNKIIQFIFGNPILIIIILGGVFNAAVRLSQKTKEQRAKRDVSLEMARKKHDALRTGRSTNQPHQPHQNHPHHPQQAQSEPSVEQIRQQRIEALRQERMAQLRALREKRAGSPIPSSSAGAVPTGSNPTQSTFTHPLLPPIPAQKHSQNPQQASRAQRTASPRPVQPRQSAQRSSMSGQIHRAANQSTSQSPRRPRLVATPPKKSQTSPPVHQKSQPKQSRRRKPGHKSAYSIEKSKGDANRSNRSARSMLRDRSSLRQAMILSEILDAPIALRDQDVSSGSLFH